MRRIRTTVTVATPAVTVTVGRQTSSVLVPARGVTLTTTELGTTELGTTELMTTELDAIMVGTTTLGTTELDSKTGLDTAGTCDV